MPCIRGKWQNRRLILGVYIIDKKATPAPPQSGGSPSSPKVLTEDINLYNALLDTGATATCISPKVVQELKLRPLGLKPVMSASGITELRTYHFSVGLPAGDTTDEAGKRIETPFTPVGPIDGLEFSGGDGFDVLLGMDVLGLGSLKFDSDGDFSFSF